MRIKIFRANFILLYIFLLSFISISGQVRNSKLFAPIDSDTALFKLINGKGVFFNEYNKRDQQFQKRLRQIVNREKIDTIIILLNWDMDVKGHENVARDNREYLIYKKLGKCYVDFFYYTVSSELGKKFKASKRNFFIDGDKIFDYFIKNRIDTITIRSYCNPKNFETDELAEFNARVNLGTNFYKIIYIPKWCVNDMKNDKQYLFYQYIMMCLRNDGY